VRVQRAPAGSIGDIGLTFSSIHPRISGAVATADDSHQRRSGRERLSLPCCTARARSTSTIPSATTRVSILSSCDAAGQSCHTASLVGERIEHARIMMMPFAACRTCACRWSKTIRLSTSSISTPWFSPRDRSSKGLNPRRNRNCIYYPLPFHQQKSSRTWIMRRMTSGRTRAAAEVFSIPIYPEMTPAEQQEVSTPSDLWPLNHDLLPGPDIILSRVA